MHQQIQKFKGAISYSFPSLWFITSCSINFQSLLHTNKKDAVTHVVCQPNPSFREEWILSKVIWRGPHCKRCGVRWTPILPNLRVATPQESPSSSENIWELPSCNRQNQHPSRWAGTSRLQVQVFLPLFYPKFMEPYITEKWNINESLGTLMRQKSPKLSWRFSSHLSSPIIHKP